MLQFTPMELESVNTSLFNRHKKYFVSLLFFILLSSLFLVTTNKAFSFISLNIYHSFWLNVFFINFTFLGDGIFAICLIAIISFYKKNKQQALALSYSFLLSGIAAQIIKNLIHSPRPKLYFEPGQYLYFIEGVTHANYASFPSGHTATAFAIATVLALMLKNKKWQLPLLLIAILVGYSRIYLAQHFLIDVIIGASIGSLSGVFSFYLVRNSKNIRLFLKKQYRLIRSSMWRLPSTTTVGTYE